MNAVENIITDNLPLWSSSVQLKSTRGRGSSSKRKLYGVKKLRELILDLAVRGLLVPQDPNDEPAGVLLEKISAEREVLIKSKTIRKPKVLGKVSEQEVPYKIPSNWVWIRLNDIGDWGAGATPRRGRSELYGGDIPWFKSGELTGDFISQSEETVTELALKESSLRLNKVGDVLLAMYGATIGKASILNIAGTTNQAVCACTVYTGISNIFLLKLLKAYRPRFISMGAGGAQPNISREKIIATPAALPPLAEQHRIVAKIDELMTLCDRLEQQQENSIEAHETLVETLLSALTNAPDAEAFQSAWERVSKHFDTLLTTEHSVDKLKETILQLAVMGKLVPQDPNDEPASELIQSIKVEKEQLIKDGAIKKGKKLSETKHENLPFPIPNGWSWTQFDSISKNENNALKAGPFGSALKKSMYTESGYKIYGQEQVISGNEDIGDYFIDREKYESLKSCKVNTGDILVSLVGTIGKVLILSESAKAGIINPRLVKLSLNNSISREYIRVVLGSRLIQDELFDKSHGSTMNVLNLGLLRQLIFPLPATQEQHRIVAKVDELMVLCDDLKQSLNEAQSTQMQLTDAVVENAF